MNSTDSIDIERYSRHLLLPEVGMAGQQALARSTVLLVGLGGLGCPAALYLAAAGVGRLILVDPDVVSLSNLQRQVLFSVADVGRKKVDAARDRLLSLNPEIDVVAVAHRLCAANAREWISKANIVVDGSDNFPARYLTSDAAVVLGVPVVYGALERFRGQVGVFAPRQGGPCYRCLFPTMPPPGLVPTCEEAGVLGVLPGIIGTLQAAEAIKWLVGIGRGLVGRMQILDVAGGVARTVPLARREDCPACGPRAGHLELKDEVWSCGGAGNGAEIEELDVAAFMERWGLGDSGGQARSVLVDVRNPEETARGVIAGARLVPLSDLDRDAARIAGQFAGRAVFLYCQRGSRSLRAASLLRPHHTGPLASLRGGIEAYCASGGATVAPDGVGA